MPTIPAGAPSFLKVYSCAYALYSDDNEPLPWHLVAEIPHFL
jgi:hypothetical protein